jgi:peptide/nickel transport system permease protein
MVAFILRRLGVLGVILMGSSFILYNLAAISADPLADLKLSTDPDRDARILALTRELQLDVIPPLRYFLWLRGVLGIFIGQPNFGTGRDGLAVIDSLALAIPVTLRLVAAATLIAAILGIMIGIVNGLRQYSRFDYSMTFTAFLLFSLPIFWVAVLLKEYLAIQFNNFLREPTIPVDWIIGIGLVSGLFWAAVIGGSRKTFWTTYAVAFAASSGLVAVIGITGWLLNPSLGPIVILVLSIGIAFGVTQISVGLANRKALGASLTMAGLSLVAFYPVNWVFDNYASALNIFLMVCALITTAVFVGLAFSKIDRAPIVRTTIITAVLSAHLVLVDKFLQTWKPYMETDAINGRPVPTVGERNDLLETTDFWISGLDVITHLFLPTLALTLIGFAGYTRFARGTMLEVMNQDYIRTARAKGIPERTVIMRHAFRNTMIPMTGILVADIAGVIGGAFITESVFAPGNSFTRFESLDGNFLCHRHNCRSC